MQHGKRELQALIMMFCGALFGGDPDTLTHSRRVARYAELIALEMGLPLTRRQRLYRAALLHDIGKIGIPRTILKKPGRLTAPEQRQIAEHPRIGRNIISRYPAFSDILGTVLHHHERFDGTGYPAGLAGSAIPLDARILTVADTLDALTSKRPYREAIPSELAALEMTKRSKGQFDPSILVHLPRLLSHVGGSDTAPTARSHLELRSIPLPLAVSPSVYTA